MIIASLELCNQLYQLSGWKEEYIGVPFNEDMPVYSLGYLLRELPNQSYVQKQLGWWLADCKIGGQRLNGEYGYWAEANNPEDAACKLAIELFRQGILQ